MSNFFINRIWLCVWLTTCGSLLADDGAVQGVGGVVRLMNGSHHSVRLVSEEVRIDLPENVKARFVFRNEGPATSVLMGFPEEGGGNSVSTPRYSHFHNFRSYVDGRRVKVRRVTRSHRGDSDYTIWWVKRVHFARGQKRIVENQYSGGEGGSSTGDLYFNYILKTGASWKGRINHARIICGIRSLRDCSRTTFQPAGYKRQRERVVWDFRNFKPTKDISIDWSPYFWDIAVNGEEVEFDNSSIPRPERKGKEVWMGLRRASDWLDMDLDIIKPNHKIRLTRGNRWVDVTIGSRWLRTPRGCFAMPRRAHLERNYTVVALTPLVRALGGKAHFNRKLGKMVVWLK